MSRWTLCLPGRLSASDAKWFHDWRNGHSGVVIELWDGDKMMELLASSKASTARRELSRRGITGIPDGGATLLPLVFVNIEDAAKRGFDSALILQINNVGDKTAKDLKVKVKFTPSHCYPFGCPPHENWKKITNGMLDCPSDFEARALHPLHNGENILVIGIPFRGISAAPFQMAVDIYAENTDAAHWFVEIPSAAFFTSGRHELQRRSSSALRDVKEMHVTHMSNGAVLIAAQMLENADASTRGVTLINQGHPSDPLLGMYMPWLNCGGQGVYQMKKPELRMALSELQSSGFLNQPEASTSTNTTVYEFRPDSEAALRRVLAELVLPEETIFQQKLERENGAAL